MAPKSLGYGSRSAHAMGRHVELGCPPVNFLPGRFHSIALELVELVNAGHHLGLILQNLRQHLLEIALLLLDASAKP